jgi:hypothetical protein
VVIPLPRERFGHLTTPSEAQQILSLIDWDFANACMVGYASKRIEEIRRGERARRRSGEPKREKETVAKASDGNALLTSRRQSQPQELEGWHPRSDRVRGYTLAAAVAYSVRMPVTLPDPAQQLLPHRP